MVHYGKVLFNKEATIKKMYRKFLLHEIDAGFHTNGQTDRYVREKYKDVSGYIGSFYYCR